MCDRGLNFRTALPLEDIFSRAEKSTYMYYIISGNQLYHIVRPNRRANTGAVSVSPGEWVGEGALWFENWAHFGWLRAKTASELLLVNAWVKRIKEDVKHGEDGANLSRRISRSRKEARSCHQRLVLKLLQPHHLLRLSGRGLVLSLTRSAEALLRLLAPTKECARRDETCLELRLSMFLWGRSWGDEQDEPSQTGFQALVRFSSYPEGDLVSWATTLSAMATCAKWEIAIALFDQLQEDVAEVPDMVLNMLLSACSRAMSWVTALQLFTEQSTGRPWRPEASGFARRHVDADPK
eukprot:g9199.t1